mgnify:CR=1 FL=1
MNDSDTASVSTTGTSTSSQRPKRFICDHEGCTKAYSKPSLLDQHKRSHTGERPFKCNFPGCGKSFLRNSHLKAHLISHTDENDKPFRCSICNKGVNSLQHLKRHEITHSKSFVCPKCGDSFYKHQSLRHHILSVHEKTLTCLVCNKTFSRPYRLVQHNLKHHGDSPAYQCDHPGCFLNVKTWSALQLHIKSEHPKLQCSICNKKCVGKKGLYSHMLSHDESKMVKMWNCNYCDVGKFAKKSDLLKHYNQFHDGNIPDELLKPNERLQLQKLLSDNNTHTDLKKLVDSSDEEEDPNINSSHDIPRSHRSLDRLQNSLSGKTSITDLMLDNFSSKRIYCTKPNCPRYFSREHDLRRHLKWHDENMIKIETFLNSLKENEDHEEIINGESIETFDGSEPPSKKVRPNHTENGSAMVPTVRPNGDQQEEDDNALDALIDLDLILLTAGGVP